MSRRDRRDGDRRPPDRRDSQPDEEQQRRPGDADAQEGESLTALKAILGKVAGLLSSLQLTQDESISLVEQLYGSVLDMDVKLAGETDDRRRSSVLAHIQNTVIARTGGKISVEYPIAPEAKAEAPAAHATEARAPERPGPQRPSPEPPSPEGAGLAAPEETTAAAAPAPQEVTPAAEE
jgi:hypothetical protein